MNGAASCFVTHGYLDLSSFRSGDKKDAEEERMYPNTIAERTPKVLDMMVAFIQYIITCTYIKINELGSIFLGGFGLGAHLAGNLGHRLKDNGKLVGAVWGKFWF